MWISWSWKRSKSTMIEAQKKKKQNKKGRDKTAYWCFYYCPFFSHIQVAVSCLCFINPIVTP